MQTIKRPGLFQRKMQALRCRGRKVGFVPTMGALHEGHLSLIRAAQRENDVVAVSLFVNPTQFGLGEDLMRYPRPLARDRALLKEVKVDFLFHPTIRGMYPEGAVFCVDQDPDAASDLTGRLCGRFRPGHFRGVMTVVTQLLHIVNPHRVYFGRKDYQQGVIVRALIRNLHLATTFRFMPTVREPDGLALSSRNRYLSAVERRRALALSQSLFWVRRQISDGTHDIVMLCKKARQRLNRVADRVQYLEAVDPHTLKRLTRIQSEMVVLGACYVGKTRLIDNVIIRLR